MTGNVFALIHKEISQGVVVRYDVLDTGEIVFHENGALSLHSHDDLSQLIRLAYGEADYEGVMAEVEAILQGWTSQLSDEVPEG